MPEFNTFTVHLYTWLNVIVKQKAFWSTLLSVSPLSVENGEGDTLLLEVRLSDCASLFMHCRQGHCFNTSKHAFHSWGASPYFIALVVSPKNIRPPPLLRPLSTALRKFPFILFIFGAIFSLVTMIGLYGWVIAMREFLFTKPDFLPWISVLWVDILE